MAFRFLIATLLAGAVAADAAEPFYANPFERVPPPAAITKIGRALFSDPALSASGQMSCATCHDPARAYGPPADAIAPGGIRAIPSLRYGQAVPPFTEHFFEADGDDSVDQGPAGGRTWDGRTQSAHEQARLPLFSSQEMANTSGAAVVAKVQQAPYAALFRATFGTHVFDDPTLAFNAVLLALEVFQQSPDDFYPYSSKYDAYLRGEATLSAEEQRGLDLFNDPTKGNCASCHPSSMKGGAFPQFTDYGFIALGLPRNPKIAANTNSTFFDLGLCGPLRTDLAAKAEYCGSFRTPSLRNIATRRSFFHNGVIQDLNDAIRFYAERDTKPERWYPTAPDGTVNKYDDLPAQYRDNVEIDAPFGTTRNAPVLTDADVAAIAAFLRTLTDGYAANATGRNPA